MKKLTVILLPVLLIFAACGDQQRKKERISGNPSGNRAEKVAGAVYTKDTLVKIKKTLEKEKHQFDVNALRQKAEGAFRNLINLNVEPKLNSDPKKDINDRDDDAADQKLIQKAQNNIWKEIKVIEVNPRRNASGIEVEKIDMRLKLNGKTVNLSGQLDQDDSGFAALKFADNQTLSFSDDTKKVDAVTIEAMSICILDDCSRILSVVRLDDKNYHVIVSARNEVKKNATSGGSSPNIKAGFADVHHIVGSQQEQMVIYLKYSEGTEKTLISDLSVQDVLDMTKKTEFEDATGIGDSVEVKVVKPDSSDSVKIRIFGKNENSDLILDVIEPAVQ